MEVISATPTRVAALTDFQFPRAPDAIAPTGRRTSVARHPRVERLDPRPADDEFWLDDAPLYDPAPPFELDAPQGWLGQPCFDRHGWSWQVLPAGLIYKTYLAGVKEPRLAAQWLYDTDRGWLMESTLGARVGIVRYGNSDPVRPEGWQWDVEGAAQPRLDLENELDLESADFRAGTYLTYARRRIEARLGYYHLSSHLGDEFLLRNPGYPRINYVRDSLVWGVGYRPGDILRLYAEAALAVHTDGGARPWEFQFGADFSQLRPTLWRPVPFFAINGHLREEVDFGGNLVVQAGAQWRSDTGGQLLRLGGEYFNGKSRQYEFFDSFEQQVGLGIWYDF